MVDEDKRTKWSPRIRVPDLIVDSCVRADPMSGKDGNVQAEGGHGAPNAQDAQPKAIAQIKAEVHYI